MALSNFAELHLPYSIQKLSDGRYLVLNREYKPLSYLANNQFIDYLEVDSDKHPICFYIKGLTKRVAREVSVDNSDNAERIFLYNDSTNPTRSHKNMMRYFERLSKLMNLKVSRTLPV